MDLAGGTLDIWPLGLLHADAKTVNVAISVEASIVLEPRAAGYFVDLGSEALAFDSPARICDDERTVLVGQIVEYFGLPPCEIRPASDSPRGGGLGASSALSVALIAAAETFLGLNDSGPEHRSAIARDLEARLLSVPTGRQDHYPALLGGALEIRYRPAGDEIRRLEVDLAALGKRLIVAFTGESHFSAMSNWKIIRRRLDGDGESRRLFEGIAAVATRVAAALEAEDYPALGALIAEEWSLRRRLAEGVSTPRLEELLAAAIGHGAWGGKVCGAGGGGCVAVLTPLERRPAVEDALRAGGAEILAAHPSRRPVRVEVSEATGYRGRSG